MRKYILVKILTIVACFSATAQFPEMQLWLKADSGTSTNESGQDVTYWNDQSLNLYNASDSSMDAPIFKPNEINFHPAVYFDGVDDGLNLGADYLYAAEDGVVIFCIVKPDNVYSEKDRQFVFDFGHYPDEGYGATYSSDKAGIYCPTSHGGTDESQGIDHSRDDEVTLFMGAIEFETQVQVCFNGKSIISEPILLGAMGDIEISENPEPDTSSKGPVTIGRQSMETSLSSDSGRLFNGSIAEIIVYNSLLTENQQTRVHSYLGLKYGISLDQSTARDYLASNGNIVWKNSENGAYTFGIAGVARDDDSSLGQGISASVNDDWMMTLGNGSFLAPGYPDMPGDMKYYSWSHNNVALDSINNDDVPVGVDGRIGRTWRVSCKDANTNSAISWDDVSITIDLDKLSGAAAMPAGLTEEDFNNLRLLVNDTNSMKMASTFSPDSVDVSSKRIIFYLEDEISNGDYFTVSRLPGSPLPVELMSFETKIVGDNVKLYWQTASEIQNDKFVVQRSEDLINWKRISSIKGAGNSNRINYYSAVDEHPIEGESYYRLKQVDFNGEYSYSENERVVFQKVKNVNLDFLIYPNPVVNQAHIAITGNTGSTYIELLDKKGQVRFADLIEDKQKYKLNSRDLENGVYILRANSGTNTSYQKIIVQNH